MARKLRVVGYAKKVLILALSEERRYLRSVETHIRNAKRDGTWWTHGRACGCIRMRRTGKRRIAQLEAALA